MPRLGSVSPVKHSHFTFDKKKEVEKVAEKEVEKVEEVVGGFDQEGEESSNCSTPTMMEPRARERVRIMTVFEKRRTNIRLSCRSMATRLTTLRSRTLTVRSLTSPTGEITMMRVCSKMVEGEKSLTTGHQSYR